MAAARYRCDFYSDQGKQYRIDVWDEDFTGSVTEFTCSATGFTLNYQGQGDERDGNIKASECSVQALVPDSAFETMITEILQADEGRFKILIYNGFSTDFADIFWIGDILNDLGDLEDLYYPYQYDLKATDGIGKAKDIMVNDSSWITTNNAYQFPVILAKCLSQIQSNIGSNGIYASNETFLRTTGIWYEPSMNGGSITTSVDPWNFSQIHESAFYTRDNVGDVQYMSVMDALDKITKAWGARLYYSNGMWHVDQITALAATTVKTHYYKIDGTAISGTAYADVDYRKTEGTAVARLAGHKYNYFQGLKKTEVDYDHQQTGQLLPTPFNEDTYYNLGTYTYDASNYTYQFHIFDIWGQLGFNGATGSNVYAQGVTAHFKVYFRCTNASGDVYYAKQANASTGPAVNFCQWGAANTVETVDYTIDILGNNILNTQYNLVVQMPSLTSTVHGEISVKWDLVNIYHPLASGLQGSTVATANWNVAMLGGTCSICYLVLYTSGGTLTSGTCRYSVTNNQNKKIHTFETPLFGDSFVTSSDGGSSYLKVYNGSSWEFADSWQVSGGSAMPFTQLLCWDFIRGQKTAKIKRMGSYMVKSGQTFLFENSLIIDSIYYVFNGGNLVAGIDQWDGEWFEVSLDSTNLTTGSANLNVNNNGNNNGGGPSNNNTNTSNNSGRINDIVPTGFGHR